MLGIMEVLGGRGIPGFPLYETLTIYIFSDMLMSASGGLFYFTFIFNFTPCYPFYVDVILCAACTL